WRRASNSYGVSSRSGGRRPPDGPPTRTAFSAPADVPSLPRPGFAPVSDFAAPAAGFGPPAAFGRPARATMSRSGVPSGTSAMPAPPAPRTATRIVPGLAFEPIAANASAPLMRIHG